MIKVFWGIVGLLMLYCCSVQAQQYNFKPYSLEHGLTQSEVFDMVIDQRGSLWVGTNGGGICRFDGLKFTTFNTRQGLSSNLIRELFEDSKGNLWVGTVNSALNKYDGKSFVHYGQKQGVAEGFDYDIVEDAQGNIWMLSQGRLNQFFLYQYINNQFIDKTNLLNGGVPLQLWTDRNRDVYIRFANQLMVLRNGKPEVHPVSLLPELAGKALLPLLHDRDGNYWFLTNPNLIYKYDGKKLSRFLLPAPFEQEGVNQLMQDSRGNIWMLLPTQGLLRYDGNRFTHFSQHNGLAANEINCITEDREGNIWLGVAGGGATRFDSERFIHFRKADGLTNEIVWAIFEDQKNNIWMGASVGSISRYDSTGLTPFKLPDAAALGRVRAFYQDTDGSLLIGTYEGKILRYDGKKFASVDKQFGLELPGAIARIMKIMKTRDGKLWFCTFRGLFYYENGKPKRVEGLSNNVIRDMVEDADGNLWIGTNLGLNKFDGKKVTQYFVRDGLTNDNILQLIIDKKNVIWMASYGGGINRYDGRKFTAIGEEQGLASSHIYSLILDEEQNLWAGTQHGIDKVILDEHRQVKSIKNYGKHDGFTSEETNGGAVFKDSHQHLWFGTLGGVTRYNPALDQPNATVAPAYITNLRLFFREVNWNDSAHVNYHTGIADWFHLPRQLVLPHHVNHLSFDFAGLSYRAPEKVRYRWKLEGLDKDWSPVSSRNEAVYPNLPPGRYTFKVAACNNDGLWNEQPATYAFEIAPPFWQTWWFRSASVGLIFGAVFMAVRARVRSMEDRKKELEAQVRERTAQVVEQNKVILSQSENLGHAYQEIQKKNHDIMASINYARRIQTAMLPLEEHISRFLPSHFILFMPRDLVSGDFYWCSQVSYADASGTIQEKTIIAAVDCTGHGVPGAFMSLIGNDLLNEIVNVRQVTAADEILSEMHRGVRNALKQDHTENRDGMDMALCVIDRNNKVMEFAGAKNPLIYIQTDEQGQPQLKSIRGDIYSVGGSQGQQDHSFTLHRISIEQPTVFYIFSDGYQDQFGREGRKFMTRRFRELLFSIHQKPMPEQQQFLSHTLAEWMGDTRQIDDILVIGVKV